MFQETTGDIEKLKEEIKTKEDMCNKLKTVAVKTKRELAELKPKVSQGTSQTFYLFACWEISMPFCDLFSKQDIHQGTKKYQYCTCPAGRETYNFHLSCKHMYLSFKSVCNKEHKGVIYNQSYKVPYITVKMIFTQ